MASTVIDPGFVTPSERQQVMIVVIIIIMIVMIVW